ncbi:MAG: class I SAM-dependent methyltransferase [Chlamydiota bacterium]
MSNPTTQFGLVYTIWQFDTNGNFENPGTTTALHMMFSSFPAHGHLRFAHELWRHHLSQGSCAIDATCGNGYDALVLSRCILQKGNGRLLCLDIQRAALAKAKFYLRSHLSKDAFNKVSLHNQCHSQFPPVECPIQLIVYNLGYLPGGNKTITTKKLATLTSLSKALKLLALGGALSVMCYPGHLEGAHEAEAVVNFFQQIENQTLSVFCYRYKKRSEAPFLIWSKKIAS